MLNTFRRAGTTLVLLSVATACGGGDKGGTNPPINVAGFTVSLSSTTLSVQQGASGSVSATIARTGSFTGTVNLSTESVPAGITATFNPSAVTSSTASTTLTVDVAASVAPGNYTFTIRGQAAGVNDQRTATISMTVTPRPSIALALSPTSASVAQGGSTSFTATVTPSNFTGATSVAITGAPAGVAPTVTTSGNTHTVAVAVGSGTAPGTYTLTATASGSGVTSVAASFALTVTAAPTGSIAIAATPNTLNATAGGAGVTSTIAITRTNYTGDVTFSATGMPAGSQHGFNPSPATGNSTTMTLTFGGTVAAGTYPINVTASGTNITPVTIQVMVTVAPALAGSIALSVSRNPVTVQQGASEGTSIIISRTNFNGQVNLSVSGVPSNVTATLGSPSTLTNGSTLTFAAASNATPGNYPITITGSGTNIPNATTTFTLTVTPAAAGNVSLQLCSSVLWVASQDGNGTWTQATAGANNTYSFTITNTGGAAWVTLDATGEYHLSIYYGGLTEIQSSITSPCSTPSGGKTHTGSVTGLGFTETATVAMGGAIATTNFATTTFTLNNVVNGATDLVAVRSAISGTGTLANAAIIQRGLNLANNASLGVLAFGGGAITPTSHTATVTGSVGGETVVGTASFLTANGSSGTMAVAANVAGSFPFAAIPTASTISTDLHVLTAAATMGSGQNQTIRTATQMFRTGANTTLALGPVLATETISSLATAPYRRLRIQAAKQSDYSSLWAFGWSQGSSGNSRDGTITATAAYIGAAGTIDLAIPDFTGVSGWNNAWAPTNSAINYSFNAFGWTLGQGGFGQPLTEGAVVRTGMRLGTS